MKAITKTLTDEELFQKIRDDTETVRKAKEGLKHYTRMPESEKASLMKALDSIKTAKFRRVV